MIPREPEEQTIGAETEPGEEDTGTLKQALKEEKEKAENYLANWQRAQADFINYKRRSEQEKEELIKFANSALMLNLLSAIDDLERALVSIPSDIAELSWVDGIRLIGRKLKAGLEAQGLTPIEVMGKPFDPNFHEAVRHARGENGIVIEEIQKGYQLHDRIIRASKVVVGNGEEEETIEGESENNS